MFGYGFNLSLGKTGAHYKTIHNHTIKVSKIKTHYIFSLFFAHRLNNRLDFFFESNGNLLCFVGHTHLDRPEKNTTPRSTLSIRCYREPADTACYRSGLKMHQEKRLRLL